MSRNLPTADLSDDEVEIGQLFAGTMSELDSDAGPMAADALRIGRPRRRHRVIAMVAASVAGVALVGGVGAYGVSSLSIRPGQSAGPAGPATTAPAPSPSPTPSETATPSPYETPPPSEATRQLTARVAGLYLIRLAPSGTNDDFFGQQSDDELFVGSTLDRGEGKVGLQINVQAQFMTAADPDVTEQQLKDFYSCGKEFQTPKCEITSNDDGSILMTTTELVVPGEPAQGTAVIADFRRADGTRVVVQTGNIADTKYGGETRRGVSAREAVKIVTDPIWDLYAKPSAKDVQQARKQITPWELLPS